MGRSFRKVALNAGLSQRRARLVSRLRARKSRAKEGRVLVEGARAVGEALESGAVVDFAIVSPRFEASPGVVAVRDRLVGSEVFRVEDAELRALSDTDSPQGVLLVCRQPESSGRPFDGRGGTLVLDAIQDPGNVGTLIRSAVAFGLGGVVCLDGTVDPWSAKAVRASTGMIFRLPVIGCTVQEAMDAFAERDVPLLVASSEGGAAGKGGAAFALVIGNEGAGVRQEIRDGASRTVAVPMTGPAESINAGIAGSILMYELSMET